MAAPLSEPVAPPADIDPLTLFRSLFTAYPDALLLVDTAGTIVLANPRAAEMLGYDVGELAGLPVDTLVPDADRPRHAAYREDYGRAPRARQMGTQMELVAKRRDGSHVAVEIALSPLQEHGAPLVVAAIRDIGEYPRVKQALRRARYSDYLAQLGRLAVEPGDTHPLLDRVPAVAAQAMSAEIAVVYLLDAAKQAFLVASGFGLLQSEPVGSRVPNRADSSPGFAVASGRPVVISDFRTEPRYLPTQSSLDSGVISEVSIPLLDSDGTLGALTLRARHPMQLGDDEIRFLELLCGLLAARLQRARSDDALAHAQRLESVGQLTGGIAHDFNNLLTIIQGNLQVLDELPVVAQDESASQLVGAASRAARRGADLTTKLLTFSRRQVLQPAAVSVGELLDSLSDMLRRTLDPSIDVVVQLPRDPLAIWVDPVQLESALLNIAINSRDAMTEGGQLCFRAETRIGLPRELRREAGETHESTRQFVAIAVSDTGNGMSEEVKARVFEPFFTTKEVGRGTGLGLSTVYGFAKQSNGAISVDSAPGAGTTVTLFFPSVPGAAANARQSTNSDEIPAGLRVLLVEDDEEVRSVVGAFLDALECKVTRCASGEEALRALSPDAKFDLLLTDITLGPNLRGTQLASEAQLRFPDLGVLLMSGFPAELIHGAHMLSASWKLLRKPYNRQELARAIACVVKSS